MRSVDQFNCLPCPRSTANCKRQCAAPFLLPRGLEKARHSFRHGCKPALSTAWCGSKAWRIAGGTTCHQATQAKKARKDPGSMDTFWHPILGTMVLRDHPQGKSRSPLPWGKTKLKKGLEAGHSWAQMRHPDWISTAEEEKTFPHRKMP